MPQQFNIQREKDRRTILAICLFLVFNCCFWFFIFPVERSLPPGPPQWIGAALVVLLIFLATIIVSFVQDPAPFFRAFFEWQANRLRRAGKKVPESHLSGDDIVSIKKKYPGLF